MKRILASTVAVLAMASPFAAQAQVQPPRDERPPVREMRDERPRMSLGEAAQRAAAGRPGRFLGASDRGGVIVVRWEYPGGRVADIMMDSRTGRVLGER